MVWRAVPLLQFLQTPARRRSGAGRRPPTRAAVARRPSQCQPTLYSILLHIYYLTSARIHHTTNHSHPQELVHNIAVYTRVQQAKIGRGYHCTIHRLLSSIKSAKQIILLRHCTSHQIQYTFPPSPLLKPDGLAGLHLKRRRTQHSDRLAQL